MPCLGSCFQRFVFRNVVVSIIEQVSIDKLDDMDHMTDRVLAEMLFRVLMDRRYLIVLDDLRDFEAWHKLTIPFPNSKNGSRVILTTFDDKVAESIDQWRNPLHLHILTNDEKWELLSKHVRKPVSCLIEHKEKIMTKLCHGSPLEILLVGGILSSTEQSYWSTTIDKLPSSREGQSSSTDILTLSYQELSPTLKACFLYLGIFPKASEVSIRRLLRLWVSEGFLRGEGRPEDLAELCLEELVCRNLIEVTKWTLDGNPKMCRMPGLLHDFFFPKSLDLGLFNVHKNSSSTSSPCIRRLVEYSEIKNSSDSHIYHNVCSYLSFNTKVRGTINREIGVFLKSLVPKRGFGLLKLLDLEGLYKPMLPDETVRQLLLLRFLGLRSTVLDSVPSAVGDLPCLETLDLKNTNVTTLPDSIWNAKNLRHFHMSEVPMDAFVRKPCKGALANLVTLMGLYVADEKAVKDGLDRVQNLQKLGLTCHTDSADAVAEWIRKLSNLESLKLRSIDEFGKPASLKEISMAKNSNLCNLYLLGSLSIHSNELLARIPLCLRKLTLSLSMLKEDPMPVLGQLHDLSILRLFTDSYVGAHLKCVSGGFPRLRVLKLWMLKNLRRWTVDQGSMPLLRELEIRRCINLENADGLKHLLSLDEVVLTNMPSQYADQARICIKKEVFIKVNNWKFSDRQIKEHHEPKSLKEAHPSRHL